MSESLGSAVLDLSADPTDLYRRLKIARARTLAEFQAMSTGAKLKMAGAFLAVGAAAGVGLYQVGKAFDDAYDKINIITGATGRRLEMLRGDFRAVFREVPSSADEVATAIGEVNTRLGATGKPLREVSRQMLNLSRLTRTDLSTNIQNITRLFKDQSIAVKDQPRAMDAVFEATKRTGAGLQALTANTVAYGVPLRQLGFGFEETLAIFGQFEQSGVNIQTVMAGMRLGLGNLVQPSERVRAVTDLLGVSGKTTAEQFRGLMEGVRSARKEQDAFALALPIVGKRAVSDFVGAVREGRFELDGLVTKLRDAGGSINDTANRTADFEEKLHLLRNRGMLLLEGPGRMVLDLMTDMTNAMLVVTSAFSALPAPVRVVVGAMIGGAGLFYALMQVRGALIALKVAMLANPYVAIAAATIAIAYLIFRNWNAIMSFLKSAWSAISRVATQAWGFLTRLASTIVNAVISAFMAYIGFLTSLPGRIFRIAVNIGISIVNGVMEGIAALPGLLKRAVENALVSALNALNPFSPVEHGGEKFIGRPLADGAVRGWLLGSAQLPTRLSDTVRNAVDRARQAIEDKRTAFQTAWSVLAEDALAAFDAIQSAIRTRAERMLAGIDARKIADELRQAFTDAEARLRAAQTRMANPLAAAEPEQTPAERALEEMQSARRAEDLARAIEDTQRRVEDAQRRVNELEPNSREYAAALDSLEDAQRAHADALYAQQEDGLRRQAALERRDVDARQAAQKELLEAERELAEATAALREDELRRQAEKERLDLDARIALKRRHFTKELDRLMRFLLREGATREEAHGRIMRLFRRYGVDYNAAGIYLGREFVTGLRESEGAVEKAAAAIAETVRIRLRSIAGTVADDAARQGRRRTRDALGGGGRTRDGGGGLDMLGGFDRSNRLIRALNANMIRDTEDTKKKMGGIGGAIKKAWDGILHEIVISSKKNWEEIKNGATWLWDRLTDLWNLVKAEAVRSWNRIYEAIREAIDLIVGLGNLLWEQVTASWERIKSGAETIWDLIRGIIIGRISAAKDAVIDIANAMRDRVIGIFQALRDRVSDIWSAIKTRASDAWQRVKDFIVNPVDAARDRAVNIVASLRDSLSGVWERIKDVAGGAWQRVKELIVNPVSSAVDRVMSLIGVDGLKGWLADRWEDIKGGVTNFATNIRDKIVNVFEGVRDKIKDFINAIIDVINILPGVEIRHVSIGARTSSAGSAADSPNVGMYAQGGKITRPLAIVGEEAPKHPEYVIPTNPAYRGRALALTGALVRELGMKIPGFALGGILGGIGNIAGGAFSGLGNAMSRVVGLPAGLLERGAQFIIDKLPNPSDFLPDWIAGLGRHAIGNVVDWVKDKVTGLFSGDSSFPGMGKLQALVSMARQADSMNAQHTPYLYGGGHGSFAGPWDCSGAVSAVLNAGGFLGSPITTDGLKVFGEGGDGQLVTIGVRGSTGRSAHTMMQLGNRFFESGSGHGAAWTGGWSGTFPIHRHPPGFAQGGVFGDQGEKIRLIPDMLGWGLRRGGIMGGLPYVGSYGSGGYVPGPDGAPALATVHGGEPIGHRPSVHIEVADGMEWLKDFIRIEIRENDRRARDTYRAGRRP